LLTDQLLYEKIISPANLERAFNYACNERVKNPFYDPLEIEWFERHKEKLLESIAKNLQTPEKFRQTGSFAFFPPKTNLCYRRMIFIPLSDLIARYAFITVIADELESRMHPKSFSNRRAEGEASEMNFLKDYTTSGWPRFVEWQEESCKKYNYMLKTDISSFYDSVSHKDIERIISEMLGLDMQGEVIKLLGKLLRVRVNSYSHRNNSVAKSSIMKQGLAIGNNPDSYLANVYLMNVDAQMEIEGIEYGRYTDDIRIFANDMPTMRRAIIVLQESLLNLGLNLNASKTKLASSGLEMEELRAKNIDIYEYAEPDEIVLPENKLIKEIDREFKNPPRHFKKEDVILTDADAKDFCKFLSASQSVKKTFDNMKFMKMWHMDTLGKIIREFSGAGKHAAWLLVQSAFFKSVDPKVQEKAIRQIEQLFEDKTVGSYAKYRMTHFLAKPQGDSGVFRINSMHHSWRPWFIEKFTEFLSEPAIELNLVAIRALRVLGLSESEIVKKVGTYSIKPIPLPVNTALQALSIPVDSYKTGRVNTDVEDESDYQDYI